MQKQHRGESASKQPVVPVRPVAALTFHLLLPPQYSQILTLVLIIHNPHLTQDTPHPFTTPPAALPHRLLQQAQDQFLER